MLHAHQTPHTLRDYLTPLKREGILKSAPHDPGALDLPIAYATDDSREARPGTLFVCKGAAFKRDYLLSALEAGAVAYVSEQDYGVDAPAITVSDIRRALGLIADLAWDHPSGKIAVCALTGTKGKTTTAYYLRGILNTEARIARATMDKTTEAARVNKGDAGRAGLLSSIHFDDGCEQGVSKLTTPEAFELERRLANAAASGMQHLVMEASSQALKYDRTLGVRFAVGAFLNIGEDHISPIEHPSFEDYFASKLKIFTQSETAVVNLDMDHADRVLAAAHAATGCKRVLTFSMKDPTADIFCEQVSHTDGGVEATVRTPRFTRAIAIPTPVRYNVENALAAIACAEGLGIGEEAIVTGFADVVVPGRMELYPTRSGKIIGIVDFAHNGMSLETMLRDLRESYPNRELCVVFGATGGKGLDRRETMGTAAGKYADRIVITEDDPGPEDPKDICETIAAFVEAEDNHAWQIVLDRPEAIRTAVRETTQPAVVIVTGKGHETRMIRKQGAEPCEADGPMLRRALEEYGF